MPFMTCLSSTGIEWTSSMCISSKVCIRLCAFPIGLVDLMWCRVVLRSLSTRHGRVDSVH